MQQQQQLPLFIHNPRQYHSAVLAMIDHAQVSIALEMYIFEYDCYGRELLKSLIQAHRRGVSVHVILDGYGCHKLLDKKYRRLRKLPFEIRIYHPLPWQFGSHHKFAKKLRITWDALQKINRRDHRKVLIADGEMAFIGSHNVWEYSLQWEEAGLLLAGKEVREIQDSVRIVWHKSYSLGRKSPFPEPENGLGLGIRKPNGDQIVFDNLTLKRRRQRYKNLLRTIRNARQRIWITTPYLCPHNSFVRALRKKAKEGVDVRLVLPSISDVNLLKWIAESLYCDFLNHDIKVFEYAKRVLHAKVFVIDNEYLVGSSNLNHRSFFQDLEIDIHAANPAVLNDIVEWKRRNMQPTSRISSLTQVDFLFFKNCLAYCLHPFKVFF